jgi:hypothetical protein
MTQMTVMRSFDFKMKAVATEKVTTLMEGFPWTMEEQLRLAQPMQPQRSSRQALASRCSGPGRTVAQLSKLRVLQSSMLSFAP